MVWFHNRTTSAKNAKSGSFLKLNAAEVNGCGCKGIYRSASSVKIPPTDENITMITKTNFKDLLETLGFTEEEDIYQKSISDVTLQVDFGKQRLIYPTDRGLIVHREDTCKISQDENFVVFECVHRLLEKGYKPEHLELERPYRIGHGASGGRADILVRDQENNPLLIIECKTAGDEFEKAWDDTRQDGGQLFSYVHQEAQTQYLCLYASSFFENELNFEYKLIPHLDNPQILSEDTTQLSFEKASKAEHRFAAWRDTYKLEFTEVGIFERNIQAYQIGKDNYTLAEDTKPIGINEKDSKYHDFRTILRKHNIARRENAFEVLVNLFLCKLVDEEENKDNLKFYWNGPASDNYFDFVDRLQNLYQRGMRKFLNEEISYISREQIDAAFWPVKNDRNATKKQIQEYFTELKFFSNSAFSFLDTHNRDLFERNTAVLSEVVQMWQGLRLKTDEQNQFLGDMFEFFLDNGIKQSEGQFFTPLPICKFIVSSLPLAEKIEENSEPLKVIDYACGSGHFLNEYAYQIKPLLEAQNKDISDYYSRITGVEKEDRLAKVAKVAAYMHGQEEIKILDADALASHPEIQREGYDVLVANPPFAVEGFLQTLNEEDKKEYQLIKATGENSNTNVIQCFFLERIYHLMAPGGIVGVIVPSSILSNTDTAHTHTREILLQFFDLLSITELGSGTFGKTGTNTVVLFLKRKEKEQKPEASEHYHNRVVDFFEGDIENSEYQDEYLIKAYCEHIEVPYEEYIKLFDQTSLDPLSNLLEYDIFKDYERDFNPDKELEKVAKSKEFRDKTEKEKSAELGIRFIAYLQDKEKDKLYYFILAHEQVSKVLIVNAPNTNQERKQFLGYSWSGAKGNEGIQYEGGETVNDIITPLFDPNDLDNGEKINTTIKRNFIGGITAPLPEHCQYVKLTDMLDFSRTDFNKTINLNPNHNLDIETKWKLVKLGEVAEIVAGQSPKSEFYNEIQKGLPFYQGKKEFGDKYLLEPTIWTEKVTKQSIKGDILMSVRAPVGNVNINPFERICIGRGLAAIRAKDNVLPNYLFNFLDNNQLLFIGHKGMSFDSISTSDELPEIKIPLPPPDVQKQIVGECDTVDQETVQSRQAITAAKQEIEKKLQAVINVEHNMKRIGDVYKTASGGTPLSKKKEYYENGTIPWINSGEVSKKEINFADSFITELGLNNSNAKLFPPGTVLLAMYGATAGKVALLNIEASTNQALCALLPTEEMIPKFLVLVLESMYQYLLNLRTGLARDNLSQEKIRNIRIPVPRFDIQQQLVAEVEQLEAKITQAQAVVDRATERKNAILTKYL